MLRKLLLAKKNEKVRFVSTLQKSINGVVFYEQGWTNYLLWSQMAWNQKSHPEFGFVLFGFEFSDLGLERNSGRARSSWEFECRPNSKWKLLSFLFFVQGGKLTYSKFGEKYLNDLYLKLARFFYEKEIRVVAGKESALEKEELVVRFESVYLPKGMMEVWTCFFYLEGEFIWTLREVLESDVRKFLIFYIKFCLPLVSQSLFFGHK